MTDVTIAGPRVVEKKRKGRQGFGYRVPLHVWGRVVQVNGVSIQGRLRGPTHVALEPGLHHFTISAEGQYQQLFKDGGSVTWRIHGLVEGSFRLSGGHTHQIAVRPESLPEIGGETQFRAQLASAETKDAWYVQHTSPPSDPAAARKWSAFYRDLDCAIALCDSDSDPAIGESGRDSVLRHALQFGSATIVRALLARGAELDVNEALVSAASQGHCELVQELLENGARTLDKALVFSARGPLYAAGTANHVKAASLLLQEGADVQAMHQNQNPLNAAILSDNPVMVRLLLEAGADPKRRDGHGRNALDTLDLDLGVAGVRNGSPRIRQRKIREYLKATSALVE